MRSPIVSFITLSFSRSEVYSDEFSLLSHGILLPRIKNCNVFLGFRCFKLGFIVSRAKKTGSISIETYRIFYKQNLKV